MIKIFSSRREKLAAEMQSGDLIVVFANETPSMPVPFLQDKNFYYLTGLEIPQAIFLLEKINNKSIAHLFILRGIPEMEVWEGKKMTVEEAKEITGIESVQYLDRFNDFISAKLPTMQRLWVKTKQLQFNNELDKRAKFVQTVRERFIHLTFQPISNLLKNLRMIKDEWEIEQFSKAIEITERGIRHIYAHSKAGDNEAKLQAMLHYEAIAAKAKHMGFSAIIAGGENATTLHYGENNCDIAENALVLLDVGAAWNNYSADISRTFPISG